MQLKFIHKILLLANLLILVLFIPWFLINSNLEFVIYAGVVLFFILLIGLSLKKIPYSNESLICLTIWAFLHMSGGAIPVADVRLYDLILVKLSNSLPILRYDQIVHTFGFFTATLVSYDILKPHLKNKTKNFSLLLIVVMAGCGFGALNEVIEFIVGLLDPGAGVGGYINTWIDLCSNLIGAILAVMYIKNFDK